MSFQPNTVETPEVWILVRHLGEGTSPLQLQHGSDKLCFVVAGRVSTSTKTSYNIGTGDPNMAVPAWGFGPGTETEDGH